ncbi:MAG: type II toxin-antitoxin system prevent-host-death family antitoxin [Elusimicrobiota bacterium]
MSQTKRSGQIGAFEAKTRLSELLREAEMGYSYVIRRRGKAVARLVPAEAPGRADVKALARALRGIRTKVRGKAPVRSLVEEGRKP